MTEPTAVDAVATRFWEDMLVLNPTVATMYGDHRFDDRLEDPSKEGREAVRSLVTRAAAEAKAVPEAELNVEDRITRDMLSIAADLAAREEELGVYELRAVNHMDGPQQLLPQVLGWQAADTPEELDVLLARLNAYPKFMDSITEIAREGVASGLTVSRIVAERTIEQMRGMLSTSAEDSVVAGAARVSTDAAREKVVEAVRTAVHPAERRYLDMLEQTYLPATRDDDHPGLCHMPTGGSLYRYFVKAWTTLELDADEIHRIGWEEFNAISAEREELAAAEGFKTVEDYRAAVVADPSNRAGTREELVARATEDIERANAVAPGVFGRLPRSGCFVKPVEEFREKDMAFAFYYPPSTDGSRPGTYYVNTYDLPSRNYHKLASTTYHEAVPGHHFQITLEMEHPNLNVFRRLGSRMVGGAYVEGWGLYAERLADELGLYRNAAERLGMLDAQAWRASRLIVDSGIHGLGWTRQQGIDQLLRTGLSSTDATIETDRYISWPGQALCYMLGMREIRRLRRELEARDGASFDLKRFHDEVIGHGSLPLATLAAELPTWVAPAG
ncbi:MAG: DUF885 domain-containing protein [Chloroflexota bacterium]